MHHHTNTRHMRDKFLRRANLFVWWSGLLGHDCRTLVLVAHVLLPRFLAPSLSTLSIHTLLLSLPHSASLLVTPRHPSLPHPLPTTTYASLLFYRAMNALDPNAQQGAVAAGAPVRRRKTDQSIVSAALCPSATVSPCPPTVLALTPPALQGATQPLLLIPLKAPSLKLISHWSHLFLSVTPGIDKPH